MAPGLRTDEPLPPPVRAGGWKFWNGRKPMERGGGNFSARAGTMGSGDRTTVELPEINAIRRQPAKKFPARQTVMDGKI